MKRIACCPECLKPVQVKDYMNPALVGFLDSVLPVIDCACGYSGLPITMSQKEYRSLMKPKKD
ncbi:MAG: hypothetical protein AB1529_04350 [Candidatus Micrarchaeota archaeon]